MDFEVNLLHEGEMWEVDFFENSLGKLRRAILMKFGRIAYYNVNKKYTHLDNFRHLDEIFVGF